LAELIAVIFKKKKVRGSNGLGGEKLRNASFHHNVRKKRKLPACGKVVANLPIRPKEKKTNLSSQKKKKKPLFDSSKKEEREWVKKTKELREGEQEKA